MTEGLKIWGCTTWPIPGNVHARGSMIYLAPIDMGTILGLGELYTYPPLRLLQLLGIYPTVNIPNASLHSPFFRVDGCCHWTQCRSEPTDPGFSLLNPRIIQYLQLDISTHFKQKKEQHFPLSVAIILR